MQNQLRAFLLFLDPISNNGNGYISFCWQNVSFFDGFHNFPVNFDSVKGSIFVHSEFLYHEYWIIWKHGESL